MHTCAMAARSVTGVVARSLGRRVGARQVTAVVARRGGGGNSSAVAPPFARLPDSKTPLHEEHELVWHDGVAPESALDFDAPHVASSEAIKWWLGGFAFFATVAGLVALTNPAGQKPGLKRQLPESTYKNALGGYREAAAEREPRTIVR